MCGICGSTRDPRGETVRRINAGYMHRGPDDEGVHVDEASAFALAARRLSVIDLEGGHQPLSNEDGTVWAVLNGEIYNHPALRRNLEARGHTFATRSDTEVLVHLWEEYGEALPHALEGMFAFAVWDTRLGTLLLARDRFGEKPLFYSEAGGELTFASELTALLRAPHIDFSLDVTALDAFFTLGYVANPRTLADGVRQLPPGHRLLYTSAPKVVDVAPYWQPPEMRDLRSEGFDGLVAEAQELLEGAVSRCLIADVPVGVMLSGGVDSSLVAALAVRVAAKPVRTFTVGYDVGGVNELEPARLAADALGTIHSEFVLTEDTLRREGAAVLRALDQPIGDPALLALRFLAGHARESVTVAIGGEGADELFAGYPRYRWLGRATAVARLGGSAQELLGRGTRYLPRGSRLARLHTVVSDRTTMERQLEWVAGPRLQARTELYGPALASHAVTELATAARGDHPSSVADTVAELMRLDQVRWLPDDVLAKADRASMAASLEMRTPYLDYRVAEFAATVPVEHHVKAGGKALLRAVCERVLPDLPRRRKTAFHVPVAEWLRGPLSKALRDAVSDGALFREGLFDRQVAQRLVAEHARGQADHSDLLWPLLGASIWLDRMESGDG